MKRRVLQFFKTTSVKGVPRIFQTKSYFLRTLWIVCISWFIFCSAMQFYQITTNYLKYDTVVTSREYNVDLSGATPETVRLPYITFCNMNPFAVDTHNLTDIPSLESYIRQAKEITECRDCTTEQRKTLVSLRMALQTTGGYFIHIGRTNATRLSHTQDAFLASCTVEMSSGMESRKLPCRNVATVVPFVDFMYYNCYTVRLPRATQGDYPAGLVVVLHLNNHIDIIEEQSQLIGHYMPGQMSGAVMVLHHKHEVPVISQDGISLPSGYYMSTKLRFVRRKRMRAPYRSCEDGFGDYQQTLCYANCLQEQVLTICGCIEYTGYNMLINYSSTGVPPCLSINQGKEWLYETWKCKEEIHLNYTIYCQARCPILCDMLLYQHDVSCRRVQ